MYDIIAILIPIILAICILLAVRFVSDAKLRRHISDTQSDAEVIRALLESGDAPRQRSLHTWISTLISLGLAMMLLHWLQLGADDPLAYGLLFVASGLGLFLPQLMGRQPRS